ncbi:hypothetical protein [Paraliomyxa miuraensis]|uniref:hypothetical protein n=1 Tax=Paraliomyxa miuraensis TaxID=376150 RepID=UPI002254CD16|nr:hypothetical protein [Paraliomyxa miuraensis]MCX4240308.1 hypothetical protein [Paraliomyxa miuraensis]
MLAPLLGALAIAGASQSVHAAEVTRVASSFEEGNQFDIHFGVAYDFNYKQAAVLREWNAGVDDDSTRLVKDLIFRQFRHTITPTVEIGLWHDLAIYATVPVVLADTRTYEFDQRADDCVFGDSRDANCVNKANSTTIRDGIIPNGGFDATNNGDPFGQYTGDSTELIFSGPARRGFDQLHVGLKYGILSQRTRSHMPNWLIGLEGRFAVGRAMTFTRDIVNGQSDGNGRVGRRIHELGAWTALSRRYRFLDPYFLAFWRQSIRASDSLFEDYSSVGSQGNVNPQSTAGLLFGTEIVPWERAAKGMKVSVYLSGSAILHYGGRGYSEIWELLADSPALVGSNDPTQTDQCSRTDAMAFAVENPGDPGYLAAGGSSCNKFEGVTDLQDFGTFGFDGGLNLHLGKHARINLGVRGNTDTRHFVTFTNRGKADASSGGDPDRVDPNTVEVNPLRRDVVDNVGRRYMIDDVVDLHGYLRVLLTF